MHEIFLVWHDIVVLHRYQKIQLLQTLRHVGCLWIELQLFGNIFLVFLLVGDLVDSPETTLSELIALGVL